MSEAKTPAPAKNGNGKPEPIKVGKITFTYNLDVPGFPAAKVIVASADDAQANRQRTWINYLPWLRHHEIKVEIPGKGIQSVMVHESHADWEPFGG